MSKCQANLVKVYGEMVAPAWEDAYEQGTAIPQLLVALVNPVIRPVEILPFVKRIIDPAVPVDLTKTEEGICEDAVD